MRKCLEKHSCMSSPFPIAILNGTFFFHSVKARNNWKRSAIKQILLLPLLQSCHPCVALLTLKYVVYYQLALHVILLALLMHCITATSRLRPALCLSVCTYFCLGAVLSAACCRWLLSWIQLYLEVPLLHNQAVYSQRAIANLLLLLFLSISYLFYQLEARYQ